MTKTQKLLTNHKNWQDTTIQDGCSFYFAFRPNNSNWECILIHPFLLNLSNGRTSGQFVSTLWFNKQVNKGDTFDFVILRLPRRDGAFRHDEIETKELIVEGLLNAERNQSPYDELEFVVIHKRYAPDEIHNIIETVTTTIINDASVKHAKHQEKVLISEGKTFGLSFDAVRQVRVSLNTKQKSREIRTKTTSESHLNQRMVYPSKFMRRTTSNGYDMNDNNKNICVYVSCPTFDIRN